MSSLPPVPCPRCKQPANFSQKRGKYFCAECEEAFDVPKTDSGPQTIFLSYAHRSERQEDFDVSEDLVRLVRDELVKDGHTVWMDKEGGIRGGHNWRERITTAICEHSHFLSFLSRRSVRDPGVCLNEIATALGYDRHIQTILVEPEDRVMPPLTISHLQWQDFRDWREIRDGKKIAYDAKSWEDWFAKRMEGVREVIADARNGRVTGELQLLRNILDPRTFEARIVEKSEGFSGRQWLFDGCQQWLDGSKSRLLWLKGSPGIGKSAFAAKLVHRERSAVVGFFMCDFQGRKNPEGSAREAVCTLAFQMASRLPDYRVKLLYQQLVDPDKILQKSADDLFEFLITEPLNKVGKIPEAKRLALVIDGLDEAGRNDGTNSLAALLHKHANKLPDWLGIIVTSRPEPYLEQTLGVFDVTTLDGQTEEHRGDMRDYIGKYLRSDLAEAERTRITEAILRKSGGTFLYLDRVCNDKTLDLHRPETLPEGVDDFFKLSFNRYFPDPEAYGAKTEPFLRLLTAAPDPLPPELGADLLGWTQRDLTLRVFEPLGSLLQEREDGLVFFHASLPAWLKDPKRSGTHCVNNTGAAELGNFIWGEFENMEKSAWREQVVQWLVPLIRNTKYWEQAYSLDKVAAFLRDSFRRTDAIEFRRRHLDLIVKECGLEHSDAVISLWKLGLLLRETGRYDESESLLRRALEIGEKVFGPEHPKTAKALVYLGYALTGRDMDGAVSAYRRALMIQEKVFGPEHPETANALGELGWVLAGEQPHHDEAEQLYRRAIEINEKACGPVHHKTAESLSSLANFLLRKRDYTGAERLYHRALEINEKTLGPEHPETGGTLQRLGLIEERKKNYGGAELLYRRALEINEKVFGQKNPKTGATLEKLGRLLESKRAYNGAELLYLRALKISETACGQKHDWTGKLLCMLGNLLEKLGDHDRAEAFYRRALEIFEELYGLDAYQAVDVRRSLAKVILRKSSRSSILPMSGGGMEVQ